MVQQPRKKRFKVTDRYLDIFQSGDTEQAVVFSGRRRNRPCELAFTEEAFIKFLSRFVCVKKPNNALMDKKNFIPFFSGNNQCFFTWIFPLDEKA